MRHFARVLALCALTITAVYGATAGFHAVSRAVTRVASTSTPQRGTRAPVRTGAVTPGPAGTGPEQPPASGNRTALTARYLDGVGAVVSDGAGRLLYRFDRDTANSGRSACTGACAAMWPPVPAGAGTPEVLGVAAALVGGIRRPDGTRQLTIAGLPVYRYAGDRTATWHGQGRDGTWWLVRPDGTRNRAGVAQPRPTSTGNNDAGNGGTGSGNTGSGGADPHHW